MKHLLPFIRSHGYELFVTGLVLTLGVVTHQLRQAEFQAASAPQSSPAAAIVTPAPTTPAPAPTPTPAPTWLRPLPGGVLTAYSDTQPQWNADMDCWQMHTGVDFAAAEGEPVCAIADGLVTAVFRDPLLGLTAIIDHGNGYVGIYAALSAAHCAVGDRLTAGESIGAAGNSADSEALLGYHLHFELLHNDLPVKPTFQ